MNVHDARRRGRRWWNLDRWDRDAIRQVVGTCPFCATRDNLARQLGSPTGVFYRSSRRSVTMRCAVCNLQWTMTWVKIHQAMQYLIAYEGDGEMAGVVARITEPALANETRGRRREPKTDDA